MTRVTINEGIHMDSTSTSGPRVGADDDGASMLFDSPLFAETFADPAMRRIFSARNVLQKWLDVESAVAGAQASLGMIPTAAAASIQEHARAGLFDLKVLGSEIRETAHPLVPVVRQLADLCGEADGGYVHYGLTTQDVIDTGTVLVLREALAQIELLTARLCQRLCALAEQYRSVPMIGRTHGQHALPITVGFKFAVILDEFGRHRERLLELVPRVQVVQIGGAVGSLASMNGLGLQVHDATARALK